MKKEQKQALGNQISAIQSKLGLLRNEIQRDKVSDADQVENRLVTVETQADMLLTLVKGGAS